MRTWATVCATSAACALFVAASPAPSSSAATSRPRTDVVRPTAPRLARTPASPAPFAENVGQMPGDVAFAVFDGTRVVALSATSMRIVLADGARRAALDVTFDGARAVRPRGATQTPATFHYFRGRDGAERPLHARTFAGVSYDEPWPGIDLRFDARPNAVEYSLVVRPGADVGAARFVVRGASRVERTKDGALAATSTLGEVVQSRPVAWQEIDGVKRPVEAAFDVGPPGGDGATSYRFVIGAHDATRAVVIDPTVTLSSLAVGKPRVGNSRTVALDLAGNVYTADARISADSVASDIPSFDRTPNGGVDVALEKYDADGTLLYATYFGGSGYDVGTNSPLAFVAVDAQGRAVLAGATSSGDLPVKLGPQINPGGISDAYVAKFAADGASLVYCGYLGGKGQDECGGLALGPDGFAYVVGTAFDGDFPVTGSLGASGGNVRRAFVAKVDDAGRVVFAYMLGAYVGAYAQYAHAVAVDRTGSVYVAGETSGAASLPPASATGMAYNAQNENDDGFVVKFNSLGTGLAYATYLNGAGYPFGIAVDSVGAAYVVGRATTDSSTFPFVAGPEPLGVPYSVGGFSGFAAKLAPQGDRFEYCGFLREFMETDAVVADPGGRAWVTGQDFTNDGTLMRVAADGTSAEFLAKATGRSESIALDPDGDAWFPTLDFSRTGQSYLNRVNDGAVQIAPPDQIDVELVKPQTARITWRDADPAVTAFEIERAKGTTNFAQIARVSQTVFSFDDAGLAFDTQYTYRVRAEIGAGRSHPSSTWSIRTFPDLGPPPPDVPPPPPPPTILLSIRHARVVDSIALHHDAIDLSGSARFAPDLGKRTFDPAKEALHLAIGTSWTLDVAAGDARWTTKRSTRTWTNVYRGGEIRLVLDLKRARFLLHVTGTDLGTFLANPVSVTMTAGTDHAAWSDSWRFRWRGIARISQFP